MDVKCGVCSFWRPRWLLVLVKHMTDELTQEDEERLTYDKRLEEAEDRDRSLEEENY